ncbi:hypothetical protein BJV74DRAFT_795068 [Russula compacta]|nr:hypothetical protein BJV74DRAFT_795068 [Russula compacta]
MYVALYPRCRVVRFSVWKWLGYYLVVRVVKELLHPPLTKVQRLHNFVMAQVVYGCHKPIGPSVSSDVLSLLQRHIRRLILLRLHYRPQNGLSLTPRTSTFTSPLLALRPDGSRRDRGCSSSTPSDPESLGLVQQLEEEIFKSSTFSRLPYLSHQKDVHTNRWHLITLAFGVGRRGLARQALDEVFCRLAVWEGRVHAGQLSSLRFYLACPPLPKASVGILLWRVRVQKVRDCLGKTSNAGSLVARPTVQALRRNIWDLKGDRGWESGHSAQAIGPNASTRIAAFHSTLATTGDKRGCLGGSSISGGGERALAQQDEYVAFKLSARSKSTHVQRAAVTFLRPLPGSGPRQFSTTWRTLQQRRKWADGRPHRRAINRMSGEINGRIETQQIALLAQTMAQQKQAYHAQTHGARWHQPSEPYREDIWGCMARYRNLRFKNEAIRTVDPNPSYHHITEPMAQPVGIPNSSNSSNPSNSGSLSKPTMKGINTGVKGQIHHHHTPSIIQHPTSISAILPVLRANPQAVPVYSLDTDHSDHCQWVDSHHELLDNSTGKGPVHVFHQVLGPTRGDKAVLSLPFDITFSFLGVHWRALHPTLLAEISGTPPPIKKDFDVPCAAKGATTKLFFEVSFASRVRILKKNPEKKGLLRMNTSWRKAEDRSERLRLCEDHALTITVNTWHCRSIYYLSSEPRGHACEFGDEWMWEAKLGSVFKWRKIIIVVNNLLLREGPHPEHVSTSTPGIDTLHQGPDGVSRKTWSKHQGDIYPEQYFLLRTDIPLTRGDERIHPPYNPFPFAAKVFDVDGRLSLGDEERAATRMCDEFASAWDCVEGYTPMEVVLVPVRLLEIQIRGDIFKLYQAWIKYILIWQDHGGF